MINSTGKLSMKMVYTIILPLLCAVDMGYGKAMKWDGLQLG